MDDYDERVELKDREDVLKKIPKVQSLAQVDMPYPSTQRENTRTRKELFVECVCE